MAEQSEGTFRGAKGAELFYRVWRPEGKARGVVAVVHGVLEHSGRYGNLAWALTQHGYIMYAFDHRGHGRSSGRRAYVDSFADFRQDVARFLALVRKEEPNLPLFLLGHSMGGLIVLNYILHHPEPLAGVVASAPAVAPSIPSVLAAVGPALSRVAPTLALPAKKGAAGTIARDPEVVRAYMDDPLVPNNLTIRLITEMQAASRWTAAHASRWPHLPLLILHGSADKLVPPAGSRAFYEAVHEPDKARHEYPGSYHEVFNDLDKVAVLADLVSWLDEHASGKF